MNQKKLKTFKLQRDSKRHIVQQIEWLKNVIGDEFDCDFIKSLYPLTKKELIEIWVGCVEKAGYPDLDWIQIYY